MIPQQRDKRLNIIAYPQFATTVLPSHLLLRTISCKTPDPVRTLCCPSVCRRANASMNSRRFLPRGSGVSCRNSPVLYLHLAKTVHSTFSPSNAVLVVANRATELESRNESSRPEARRKPQNSAGCRTVGPGPTGGAETHVGQGAETRVGVLVRHTGTKQ